MPILSIDAISVHSVKLYLLRQSRDTVISQRQMCTCATTLRDFGHSGALSNTGSMTPTIYADGFLRGRAILQNLPAIDRMACQVTVQYVDAFSAGLSGTYQVGMLQTPVTVTWSELPSASQVNAEGADYRETSP